MSEKSGGHTVTEAEVELASARVFRREPASWAVEVAREARRVDEAAFAGLDDAILGTPYVNGGDPMEAHFVEAGLCEESARVAAKGLREGTYFSFADAAIAQSLFDPGRRNVAATSARIGEVARRLEGDGADAAEGSEVSESALDALDDAVFGKPVGGFRRWV